jgi:hypothetical protein
MELSIFLIALAKAVRIKIQFLLFRLKPFFNSSCPLAEANGN